MADRSLLRLPADVHLVVGEDTLVVRHEGDVELEQSFGRRLVRLEAGGNATLRNFRATGTLRAGATLAILGPADLDDAAGDIVEIGDVDFTARTVVATTRVIIGRASLNVDIISAPEVVIHPDATGRIRLLDCLHEAPATRVRGCLSVNEYEADHGDVATFLSRRGVQPVVPLKSVPVEPEVEATPAPVPTEAVEETVAKSADETPTLWIVPPQAEPAPEAVTDADPEPEPPSSDLVDVSHDEVDEPSADAEGPPALDDEDLEPLPAQEPPPASMRVVPAARMAAARTRSAATDLPAVEAEIDVVEDDATVPPPRRGPTRAARSLDRAMERLQSAYPEAPPESVEELLGLVRRGRVHLISGRIDDLWVATLKHHLAERSAIPRSALLAFHALREARDRA